MLTRLYEDHRNITVLLDVLQAIAEKLKRSQKVNMSLVSDVINYMQNYGDRCHHPVEDIIYNYYCQHYPAQGSDTLSQLTVEHERLQQANEMLSHSVNMVLNDVMVPMEQLVAEIEHYIDMQRQHLGFEEQDIFPQLEVNMSTNDWQEISTELQPLFQRDPLFGNEGKAEFQALKQYINDDTYVDSAP
ncbi:hemerythrin domain-containing protein [Paraferrimonas haliotis]|uniref:Hemerythrin n=1 Tax=Paraferrimonas haliotis TaxID=2013866 RepID=A0AA37TLE6_9GAMM|nr:hemerythrin domain-containing protein [Paraferrimonas haliotis]GLS82543.1 hemerythrin [Paraferrimonas haliotis]